MKYISIFFAVLLIWLAVILIAVFAQDRWTDPGREALILYFMTLGSTLVLFIIGFGKK